MTTPSYSNRTYLEDINDELASLQFDINHKYHSGMEHFDLLQYMDKLKQKKAELEMTLTTIAEFEEVSQSEDG